MKQLVIIGLGVFGKHMLEELTGTGCELLIIDKDREVIEAYKGQVTAAYIADALSEEIIQKLVPSTIDAAIVDLGDRTEASILVTNYLKKMGVKQIIAKAETDEHGEILELVGATRIIFPNREAAKRIAPLLISDLILSYLPVSKDFVIAEIKVPAQYVGKSLIEADFRRRHNLNVIAFRKRNEADYAFFAPEYRLQTEDILLVVGRENDVVGFTEGAVPVSRKGIANLFKRLFARKT